ncbi:TPA: DUF551 domain-containing protein [Escherichia coli]|nr:DUF551 domain-containing protein [Escherichia coli]HAL1317490.1 DUF551 domain-containing protein [Escherichia coli]HAM0134174.1 DUF551 domain-containing protein [Escherichia coli]HCO8938040.1 DUF551 domain-containing protein [Escherichia coli]HEA2654810.1 DUF551 domain-containing protein [Escherichia coli]
MTTITKEFTKEQLIEQAKKNIEVLRVAVERVPGAYDAAVIHLKLAEITLASLEAEPIGEVSEKRHGLVMDGTVDLGGKSTYRIIKGEKAMMLLPLGTKFYTAPPAPVIQADVAQAIENLKQKLVECNRYNYCADAVKGVEDACLAAMRHGPEPVSQTYKLPVNTPCQDAPAHIWLQTAGVWPEDGELSELTWCSHNQHHDDTLYVRADLVNGNYPATPDSWISCSERMPNDKQYVWFFGESRGFAGRDTFEGYYDWSRNKWWAVTDIGEEPASKVTHWMPLPEPPQEAK